MTKTEAMLFGTSQRLSKVNNFKLDINGFEIKRVTKFKYLGVIFDEHINWNEHIKAIVSKAGTRVGLLGRVRRYISSYSANTIYLSMIRPILEYCTGVCACCGETNSASLEAVQKHAGRIIVKLTRSDVAMEALKWQSLRSRRDEHICKLVRKCIDGR